MEPRTKTRAAVSGLLYLLVNAVLFGAGVIVVLSVPALRIVAFLWLPVVVMASLLLAAPVAWWIAPYLTAPPATQSDRRIPARPRSAEAFARRPAPDHTRRGAW